VRRIFEEVRSSQDFLPALLANPCVGLVLDWSLQRDGSLFSEMLGFFICYEKSASIRSITADAKPEQETSREPGISRAKS
jgi:hypothetical protein